MRNLLYLLFLILLSCSSDDNLILVKNSGTAQGSFYHIQYLSDDGVNYKSQIDSVFREIDSSLSIYKEYSIISKLNNGQDLKTDLLFNEVFLAAEKVYLESKGNFDCSVSPLVDAWGFYQDKLGDSIQESVLNSSLFIRLYKKSQQDYKEKSFLFDYLNGKCFNCKSNKLSPIIDEKIKAGTVLKCPECQSFNKKTIPDKLAMSPLFIAGVSIFLFEKFNQYEAKIMLGSLVLSLVVGILLAKFWVNEKLEEFKEGKELPD